MLPHRSNLKVATKIDTDTALDRASAQHGAPHTLAVSFSLQRPWMPDHRPLPLTAIYLIGGGTTRAFVTEYPVQIPRPAQFDATAHRCRAAIVDFTQPLQLVPVEVPKPWGREIWYSAIEARGVSGVTDGRHKTPLPWILACAPRRLCLGKAITLLKVLDPYADAVRGDLYFELHDVKEEVYVVTRIDRSVWPDGRGAIRFGMNTLLRNSYGDDDRFRVNFLASVLAYQKTRRTIDDLLAEKQTRTDTDFSLLSEIDPTLIDAEHTQREAMYAFTELRPLAEGDVVQVPTLVPHALQHGVRVIELQTPVYERSIISFGQKVLTQNHWDSADAIARMRLDAPPTTTPAMLTDEPGCEVESIALFDAFAARRVRLAAGAEMTLPSDGPYVLCIGISGEMTIGAAKVTAEAAYFVPGTAMFRTLSNRGDADAVVLLAGPMS